MNTSFKTGFSGRFSGRKSLSGTHLQQRNGPFEKKGCRKCLPCRDLRARFRVFLGSIRPLSGKNDHRARIIERGSSLIVIPKCKDPDYRDTWPRRQWRHVSEILAPFTGPPGVAGSRPGIYAGLDGRENPTPSPIRPAPTPVHGRSRRKASAAGGQPLG